MKTLLDSITEQIENMSSSDLIQLNNTYCLESGHADGEIYDNDEDFFNTYFESKPLDAVRACHFGNYNFADDYIRFNGYGNLDSISYVGTDDLVDTVQVIAEYAIENESAFGHIFDFDVEEVED